MAKRKSTNNDLQNKGVIRIHKSKKERQHNGQKMKDRQHNGQKMKNRQHNGQKMKNRQHNGQKKKDQKDKLQNIHIKLKI